MKSSQKRIVSNAATEAVDQNPDPAFHETQAAVVVATSVCQITCAGQLCAGIISATADWLIPYPAGPACARLCNSRTSAKRRLGDGRIVSDCRSQIFCKKKCLEIWTYFAQIWIRFGCWRGWGRTGLSFGEELGVVDRARPQIYTLKIDPYNVTLVSIQGHFVTFLLHQACGTLLNCYFHCHDISIPLARI